MIPILYEGNEKNFLNNGLGRLPDAITCKVTEERNGTFELEMTYPITGLHFSEIAENRIILAKTEDGGNNQAFIIYKVSKPLNGIVTVNAEHISYLLNGFVVMPFTAVSCADAFSKIAANTVLNTPFEYYTDVQSTVAFKLDAPRSVRGLLGGEQGSILDTYGGYDYKFDNFNVYLYQNRGADNGVSIRYGKNLTGLKNVVDATNIYTGIVPYWADSEGNTVYLPERVVLSEHSTDYPYTILKTVDFSSEFETQPTEAQLRTKAQSYVANSGAWKLKNSIDVSFINLGQTEEYKHVAALERVKLCDYVTVIYDKLGIDVKTKVIKTVYNVLTERYDTISLGDTTYTLAQAIQGAIDTPTMTEVSTNVKNAVARATKLIQGGLGGHVVFNTDGNGEPQEILIMDTDDMTTAVNVIRMNLNGIGFSHNGYEGPFDTAWTIDGHFVADYIDTGNLNGNLIQANTISASALSVNAKKDLGAYISYISENIFDDITLWFNPYSNYASDYYETVSGKKYLVLDATGVTDNFAYWISTSAIAMGDNVTLNCHIKFHLDQNTTLTYSRDLIRLKYYDDTGEVRYTRVTISARTITANEDVVIDGTMDVPYQVAYSMFQTPTIQICNPFKCKMSIEELTVTTETKDYLTSSMTFAADGLSINVEGGTHDLVAYDAMSNLDRWENDGEDYGVTLSTTTVTHEGQTYDALVIDMSQVQTSDTYHLKFITDLMGTLQFGLSFKYFFDTTISAPSNDIVGLGLHWKTTSGTSPMIVATLIGYNTFNANTHYEVSRDFTITDADYYAMPPYAELELYSARLAGAKLTLFDFKVTCTGNAYKKAQVSLTADGLATTVQLGNVISSINQSAEQITIKANKLDLTGDLSLKGQFQAFNPNDLTDYIDMTDGAISVYNNGINVFTVSCTELLNDAGAGVFFGDVEDPATLSRYTLISGKQVRTPYLYIRADGSHDNGGEPPSGVYLNCEGDAQFHSNLSAVSISTPVQMQAGDYNTFYNNSYFYGNVYNSNGGTVFVSDKRKKKNIKDLALDKAKSFLMALIPRAFKYKDGTSGRFHHGFIAQEVKQAMSGDDWGLYIVDKERDFIGLRYDEIIADLVKVVQDQEERISALERKIK